MSKRLVELYNLKNYPKLRKHSEVHTAAILNAAYNVPKNKITSTIVKGFDNYSKESGSKLEVKISDQRPFSKFSEETHRVHSEDIFTGELMAKSRLKNLKFKQPNELALQLFTKFGDESFKDWNVTLDLQQRDYPETLSDSGLVTIKVKP